jgi:hypothetical protein
MHHPGGMTVTAGGPGPQQQPQPQQGQGYGNQPILLQPIQAAHQGGPPGGYVIVLAPGQHPPNQATLQQLAHSGTPPNTPPGSFNANQPTQVGTPGSMTSSASGSPQYVLVSNPPSMGAPMMVSSMNMGQMQPGLAQMNPHAVQPPTSGGVGGGGMIMMQPQQPQQQPDEQPEPGVIHSIRPFQGPPNVGSVPWTPSGKPAAENIPPVARKRPPAIKLPLGVPEASNRTPPVAVVAGPTAAVGARPLLDLSPKLA